MAPIKRIVFVSLLLERLMVITKDAWAYGGQLRGEQYHDNLVSLQNGAPRTLALDRAD